MLKSCPFGITIILGEVAIALQSRPLVRLPDQGRRTPGSGQVFVTDFSRNSSWQEDPEYSLALEHLHFPRVGKTLAGISSPSQESSWGGRVILLHERSLLGRKYRDRTFTNDRESADLQLFYPRTFIRSLGSISPLPP